MTTVWPEVALGDVCKFNYGKSLPASERTGDGAPVFGSNGQVGSHATSITSGPTVVVGRKGSCGEVHYSRVGCWPIDTTYFIDEASTTADLRWLYYRLRSLGLTELNRAAAIPGLNREDAYRKTLLLPPVQEQRRIAAILDVADDLRGKRRASLALLDTLTESIFLDMFGDPATNSRGFPSAALGDLASVFSDGPFGSNLKSSHYQPDGVRVVRLQNIGVGRFVDDDRAYISREHYEMLKKHTCLPGDVLVGTLGDPNLRACIQPPWLRIAINKADCVQVRPDPAKANSEFVAALLNLPSTGEMASSLVMGQTRSRISMGRLRTLRVPVPPLGLQQQFDERLSGARRAGERANSAATHMDDLFASLQHRAFRGEL